LHSLENERVLSAIETLSSTAFMGDGQPRTSMCLMVPEDLHGRLGWTAVSLVDALNFILEDRILLPYGLLRESAVTESCRHRPAPFSRLDNFLIKVEVVMAEHIKIEC